MITPSVVPNNSCCCNINQSGTTGKSPTIDLSKYKLSEKEIEKLCSDLKVNFDNSPNLYTKLDYKKLITAVIAALAGSSTGDSTDIAVNDVKIVPKENTYNIVIYSNDENITLNSSELGVEIQANIGELQNSASNGLATTQDVRNYVKNNRGFKRIRWAKNGRIDLDNLNGIDYVLVPCKRKRQLLYITDKNLKKRSETTSLLQLFGYPSDHPIEEYDINEFYHSSNPIRHATFKSCLRKISKWMSDEQCVIKDYDSDQLPFDKDKSNFVYIKQFVWNTKSNFFSRTNLSKNKSEINSLPRWSHPLKFDKLTVFGHQQYFYGKQERHTILSIWEDLDEKVRFFGQGFNRRYNKYITTNDPDWDGITNNIDLVNPFEYSYGKKVTKVPYAVVVNPFNKKYGGAIPVKNGKLLLDKAFIIKNKSFVLESTGEVISFDQEGQCKNTLAPSKHECWTYFDSVVGHHHDHYTHFVTMTPEQMSIFLKILFRDVYISYIDLIDATRETNEEIKYSCSKIQEAFDAKIALENTQIKSFGRRKYKLLKQVLYVKENNGAEVGFSKDVLKCIWEIKKGKSEDKIIMGNPRGSVELKLIFDPRTKLWYFRSISLPALNKSPKRHKRRGIFRLNQFKLHHLRSPRDKSSYVYYSQRNIRTKKSENKKNNVVLLRNTPFLKNGGFWKMLYRYMMIYDKNSAKHTTGSAKFLNGNLKLDSKNGAYSAPFVVGDHDSFSVYHCNKYSKTDLYRLTGYDLKSVFQPDPSNPVEYEHSIIKKKL